MEVVDSVTEKEQGNMSLGHNPAVDHQEASYKQRYWKSMGNEDFRLYVPGDISTISSNDLHKIKKVEIGESDFESPERVIMIVGATGAGKSTLINAMVNYMFGVAWTDDFRYKLIEDTKKTEAKSQTNWVSAYTIHHQPWFKVPYTLTIIDTPGFGDTGGIRKDEEITEQIRKSFNTAGVDGISRLDAVGFVAQSSHPRLTPTDRYIYEKILSLFGRDIKGNIFMLLTFSDGQQPPVLSALEEARVSYKKCFSFNNTAVHKTGPYEDGNCLGDTFWEMGLDSFGSFIQELDKVESRSLCQSKEVLDERKRLEITLQNIQRNLRKQLHHLEQLQVEHNVLKEHKTDIDNNFHFSYEVNEQIEVKQASAERIAYKTVEKRTEDLKRRFEEAEGKELSANDMIKKSGEELSRLQLQTFELIQKASDCIARLDEIALRPRVMSTIAYIDLLTSREKSEGKPGWKERSNQLMKLRSRTQISEHLWERRKSMYGISPLLALCRDKPSLKGKHQFRRDKIPKYKSRSPITMYKNRRQYIATVVHGEGGMLRGQRSDVSLKIPKKVHGIYFSRVHRDHTRFKGIIPEKECIIGPLVEFGHLGEKEMEEDLENWYEIRIPHCISKQEYWKAIKVRNGSIFNKGKLFQEVPPKEKAANGEMHYEINEFYIQIFTKHFCHFTCSICPDYSCSASAMVFLFGKLTRSLGNPNSFVQVKTFLCSKLFSITDFSVVSK